MNRKNKDIIDDNAQFNGVGTESVYVYTFESLVKRKNRKNGMIKMKIGMTTQSNPYDRIKQQIGASGHEKIILMHVYRTHKGYQFENNVHNKLKKMGRHITKKDAVGTEWFWVKEKEVTKILNESNKEIEKAFPRDKNLSKINKKSGIKLLMLLCLPVAIFIDATTLAVPAFIISVLSVFIKDD
jgi:hypothetical protein